MPKTWLSITVELLGGRGEELWPWPGRVFAVGPAHSFLDLADAVNDAFGRWDMAHLSVFTLGDGRVITDPETGAEMASSVGGPLAQPLELQGTKVVATVKPGDEFQYVFDLGDAWTHRCVVDRERVDPMEELGARPRKPLASWGWGTLPDQYGRRWSDDDGASRPPRRPGRPHPMLLGSWPSDGDVPDVDLQVVRAAVATRDADRLLAALEGCIVDDVLQQVGAGIPLALEQRRARAETVAVSIINRLSWRDLPGDAILAGDLVALLRGDPPPGRVLPVDLGHLASELEGDVREVLGGYVDLRTGEVVSDVLLDPDWVGENDVDVEEHPDRWLRYDRVGSRAGWQDMVDFAGRQRDQALRSRLEAAVEGQGAFRRFRDLLDEEGLGDRWHAFSDDRQHGRAREFLAAHGIRVR